MARLKNVVIGIVVIAAAALWLGASWNVAADPPMKLPDLTVDKIGLDSDCQVVVQVRNLGPGSVPDEVWTKRHPKSASVYLLIDGKKWGGGTIWHFDPAKALQPPGGTAVYKSNLKVKGTAKITAIVDFTRDVKERSEANNAMTSMLTCRDDLAKEDLTVKLVRYPKVVQPGQDLGNSLGIIAHSTFASPLTNVSVDIVLCKTDSYPTPVPFAKYSPKYTDRVLLKGGRESVDFPAGPASIKVKLNGSNTIPSDTPPGTYFLGVVIDAGNRVVESAENNNVAFGEIHVK